MRKTVICSHGFGVKADSRGMFPDIAAEFPGYHFEMFDYNEVLPGGDTRVGPLDEQAKKLQRVIDRAETDDIILLAHSQGCMVAGLVELTNVSQVILLAPPVASSMERVIDMIASRPTAEIDINGMSKLPRSDGTTTFLPKEYMQSLNEVKPLGLYQKIASAVPMVIIRATQDDILGETSFDGVKGAALIDIPADHNFTGDARAELIATLKKVFV